MEPDIGVLLGAALRDIRVRTTGTQDEWQSKSQAMLTLLEGRAGKRSRAER